MDELENFIKKAAYLVIGGVSLAIEGTQKTIQDILEQTPILVDEMIGVGEAKYNEWYSQQQNNIGRPSAELRQRLFILVKGDWSLAERLLEQERIKNPGNPEDWYWEKVILDLERDNHR